MAIGRAVSRQRRSEELRATKPAPDASELSVLADGGALAVGHPDLALGHVTIRRDEELVSLFSVQYVPLCRLAYLLLGDAARAEDVVQEAFLRTFAGWGRIRQPELAAAYLRRSVVNLCRSGLRHRPVERRGNSRSYRDEADGAGGWEDDVASAHTVLDAVRALPPRQRATVVLRYYLDLSEADIAATLGTSPGTVKSQLAKARAHLAELLGEQHEQRMREQSS
jgi:RNA polymerase sigma-70 factor (sigma-E family)